MDFIPKVKLNYEPDEEILKEDESKEENPNFVYEDEESNENEINPSNNGMSEDKEIKIEEE